MSGRGSLGCIAVILWVLLGVLWSRAAAAETMLAGRDYLLLGTASDAQPPLRECSPQVLDSLVDGIEIPAPAEGWPGTPQAVDVFNVFAGEVMVAQGDRQICGNMQDARSRDSRFRAGIGMVFVPEAGSLQPIRVAWSPPLKARWVPTVRLGAPSELQREDTARLLVRTACIAVVMALALSALMGFVTTRDRSFLIYTLFCILLIGWQAVLSGLNGYPEPWLPVGDHANHWLLILSAVSVSAVIVILWRLCGAAQVLGISRRWAHGLSWLTMLLAISTPWLSWSQLNWGAEALNAVMILVSVIGLLVAVVAVWRGDHDAFDGVAALLPLLVLAVADVTANDLLVEYRIEALQLSNTWFLMMSAYALNRRLGQLRRQRDELRQLADTDVLTGLPNRRAGLRQLEHYVRQARAEARPLSIGFLDIDLFKQINDHYGHEVGDDVLIAVARTLSGAIRNRDDVIRMGGEEFLVLLPGTPGKVALARLNQLREQVMQVAATLPHEGLRITASIGLAELGAVGDDVRGLLRRADNAMYSAKRAGRNCVYPAPPFNITS